MIVSRGQHLDSLLFDSLVLTKEETVERPEEYVRSGEGD